MSPTVTRHVLVLFVASTALLGAAAPTATAAVDATAPTDATIDAPAATTANEAIDSSGAVDSSEATLSVGSANASPGETVTVTVTARGENVAGYQANLTWDASVLRVESVSGANFSDPVTNQGPGWVFATQSQSDGVDSPTVARVTFTVVGDPGDETAIAFEPRDSSVNNESAQLDTALESGTVSVDAAANAEGDATDATTDATSDDATTASDSSTAESETDAGGGTTAGDERDDGDGGGVPPTLLVGGIAGAGGILGAGYLLGKQTGGSSDGGGE